MSQRCRSATPTTVLSLHQPLASMLAYGLQRVEGRVWSSSQRGPLWIHAAAKQPSADDIAYWEELYRHVHSLDGTTDSTCLSESGTYTYMIVYCKL